MNPQKVLVVDDNSTTRKVFRLALELEGYTIVDADCGLTALEALDDPAIALVLLDCRLPDIEGPDVARQMHERFPTLPIVAVTGWAQMDDVAMMAAGFVEVLVKPVAPSRLVEVVQQQLGQAPAPPRSHGQKVLLIDDEPSQRKLMRLALANAGFVVFVAADGESGVAIARDCAPDVVLSDVLMPKMDGFEVCRVFRRDPELRHIPVVLMSAHYLEPADRELGSRFGAARYVSRAEGIDTVIREVLESLDASASPPSIAPPPWDLREQYLTRVTHQLERQAALTSNYARRASLQSTAVSILGSISDALAKQRDPEAALSETLANCLDAAGLSVGAILLYGEGRKLVLRAEIGTVARDTWSEHSAILEKAVDLGTLRMPSEMAGQQGDELVAEAGVKTALVVPIVAQGEAFGVFVLGSSHDDYAGADGESFIRAVRAVSTQLGQALALSRLFSRLTAAEERYRALVDNARDAITILSPAGIILELNKTCEEVTGLSRGEVVGRHVAEFLPGGNIAESAAQYVEQITKGGGAMAPTPILRPDGKVFHLEFSSTVVEVGGRRLVLLIGRDVSDRQRLAEQLRHAQKLEAVGQLAGGIAHDMNNILAVVLSYSRVLQDTFPHRDPRREDAEEIQIAAERGAGLVRQLLAFSRRQIVQPRNVHLNDIVHGMDRMLRTLLGENTELETVLAPGLPLIRVDRGMIEQVIMNLAVNARDAMPRGGRLTVATGLTSDQVSLQVTDNGTGMDAETLQHLYEPFFTTKEVGKGTGLGLATVFGIVKQAGGDIEVESTVGVGTTFSIYLPAALSLESQPPPPSPTNSAHRA